MKTIIKITLVMLLCILSTSCNDSKLTQEIVGSWQYSYTQSFEDESKDYVCETLTFEKNKNEDGGTFVEELYIKEKGEIDDLAYSAIIISSITGTWNISLGDLEMKYKISSLNVNVNKDSIDIDYNNFQEIMDAIHYTFSTLSDVRVEYAKEIRKNIYQGLFTTYKSYIEDDAPYSNLEIKGDILSFDSDDMGRVVFHKVTNNNEENTDVPQESTNDNEAPAQNEDSINTQENSEPVTIDTENDETEETSQKPPIQPRKATQVAKQKTIAKKHKETQEIEEPVEENKGTGFHFEPDDRVKK